jgi:hypothetical protein
MFTQELKYFSIVKRLLSALDQVLGPIQASILSLRRQALLDMIDVYVRN